jgi:hypothetical protein
MEQLIAHIFMIRNATHIAHWKTNSYAQHKALGKFYESVIEVLDGLVEASMGAVGVVGDIPEMQVDSSKEILETLKDEVVWISKNKPECCKNIAALENIVDEIVALYLQTIYKLENLR